jgi:hypothetical protein
MCKEVGNLGNNVGRMVEHMIGGKILDKFHTLGYAVDDYTRNHLFITFVYKICFCLHEPILLFLSWFLLFKHRHAFYQLYAYRDEINQEHAQPD